jgi:hypothetical protein
MTLQSAAQRSFENLKAHSLKNCRNFQSKWTVLIGRKNYVTGDTPEREIELITRGYAKRPTAVYNDA